MERLKTTLMPGLSYFKKRLGTFRLNYNLQDNLADHASTVKTSA